MLLFITSFKKAHASYVKQNVIEWPARALILKERLSVYPKPISRRHP